MSNETVLIAVNLESMLMFRKAENSNQNENSDIQSDSNNT